MDKHIYTDKPWNKPWPVSELECTNCPVCGSSARVVLHEGLIDNIFECALGKWTLWKCMNCRSAYIDPRPTFESIYTAYANYYTHREVSKRDDYIDLGLFRKLRRKLVNGYTNWRYYTSAEYSSIMGVFIAYIFPLHRRVIDHQYRYLPQLPKNGGSLLDVGCGDGAFLALAHTCGWDVTGLDPDPKAVENVTKQGLSAYLGGIEYFEGKTNLFDVITMNHVIEHVHKPIKLLEACYKLLKSGGQLWLETPNINSFGHTRFKKNWRGIEAPRHLVLFNRHSLKQAILSVGFTELHDCPQPNYSFLMYNASLFLEQGKQAELSIKWILHLVTNMLLSEIFPNKKEFLAIIANKNNE